MLEVAAALEEGALKYCPWNWRKEKVSETIYVDAAIRHLMQFLSGEDIDPDSGLHHVTKAIAGLVILRDAQVHGCSHDNRHVKQDLSIESIRDKIKEIHLKYPTEPEPEPEPEPELSNGIFKTLLLGASEDKRIDVHNLCVAYAVPLKATLFNGNVVTITSVPGWRKVKAQYYPYGNTVLDSLGYYRKSGKISTHRSIKSIELPPSKFTPSEVEQHPILKNLIERNLCASLANNPE